jgi:hypothetical protein
VNSIASTPSEGTIQVDLKGEPSTAQKVAAIAVSLGLFLLAAGIGLGNSKYHRCQWIVFGILICCLGIVLTAIVITTVPAQVS